MRKGTCKEKACRMPSSSRRSRPRHCAHAAWQLSPASPAARRGSWAHLTIRQSSPIFAIRAPAVLQGAASGWPVGRWLGRLCILRHGCTGPIRMRMPAGPWMACRARMISVRASRPLRTLAQDTWSLAPKSAASPQAV